jgi:prepilin-type N-terminal cleavage/methylation domain-containing protein
MKKSTARYSGFSLLELLVVLSILAFFAMLALPRFSQMISRAKRSEAHMHLRALWAQEMAYHAAHGVYTHVLAGPNGLGWSVYGNPVYTYGFIGTPGLNHIIGSAKASGSSLAGTGISGSGFIIGAAADIDGDGVIDYLTIDQDGIIKQIVDDTL